MFFSIQYIADTTKRMKVRDVGLFVPPQFIWSLIQNWSDGNSILNITCCIYSFCPKVLCHVSLLDYGTSHLLQSPILPFYNSILLWSSRAGEIMGYAIRVKQIIKVLILKFSTMIASDIDNFIVLFILHLGTEGSKYRMRLVRASEELYPCPTAVIINDD